MNKEKDMKLVWDVGDECRGKSKGRNRGIYDHISLYTCIKVSKIKKYFKNGYNINYHVWCCRYWEDKDGSAQLPCCPSLGFSGSVQNSSWRESHPTQAALLHNPGGFSYLPLCSETHENIDSINWLKALCVLIIFSANVQIYFCRDIYIHIFLPPSFFLLVLIFLLHTHTHT